MKAIPFVRIALSFQKNITGLRVVLNKDSNAKRLLRTTSENVGCSSNRLMYAIVAGKTQSRKQTTIMSEETATFRSFAAFRCPFPAVRRTKRKILP